MESPVGPDSARPGGQAGKVPDETKTTGNKMPGRSCSLHGQHDDIWSAQICDLLLKLREAGENEEMQVEPPHAVAEPNTPVISDHYGNVASALDFLRQEVCLELGRFRNLGRKFRPTHVDVILNYNPDQQPDVGSRLDKLYVDWLDFSDVREALSRHAASIGSTTVISSLALRNPKGVEPAFDAVTEALELCNDILEASHSEDCMETTAIQVIEAGPNSPCACLGIDGRKPPKVKLISFQQDLLSLRNQWLEMNADNAMQDYFRRQTAEKA